MPKMIRAFRQRERMIERVWNPLAPNFLVYAYGGQVFSRTYPLPTLTINTLESGVDARPVGFFFLPDPQPPLVPVYGQATLNTINAVGGLGDVGGVNPTGIGIVNPQTITPPSSTTNPTTSATVLGIDAYALAVGLASTPLRTTAFNVKRATVLAASANIGTLWLSGGKGQPAGQGFPLVAGAAKDIGLPNDVKDVDLSAEFLIGTDAADKAFIEYEK